MKKITSAICTAALIIMIPALFIAYLYSNATNSGNQSLTNKAKSETSNAKQEKGFRPGQMAFLKG